MIHRSKVWQNQLKTSDSRLGVLVVWWCGCSVGVCSGPSSSPLGSRNWAVLRFDEILSWACLFGLFYGSVLHQKAVVLWITYVPACLENVRKKPQPTGKSLLKLQGAENILTGRAFQRKKHSRFELRRTVAIVIHANRVTQPKIPPPLQRSQNSMNSLHRGSSDALSHRTSSVPSLRPLGPNPNSITDSVQLQRLNADRKPISKLRSLLLKYHLKGDLQEARYKMDKHSLRRIRLLERVKASANNWEECRRIKGKVTKLKPNRSDQKRAPLKLPGVYIIRGCDLPTEQSVLQPNRDLVEKMEQTTQSTFVKSPKSKLNFQKNLWRPELLNHSSFYLWFQLLSRFRLSKEHIRHL